MPDRLEHQQQNLWEQKLEKWNNPFRQFNINN